MLALDFSDKRRKGKEGERRGHENEILCCWFYQWEALTAVHPSWRAVTSLLYVIYMARCLPLVPLVCPHGVSRVRIKGALAGAGQGGHQVDCPAAVWPSEWEQAEGPCITARPVRSRHEDSESARSQSESWFIYAIVVTVRKGSYGLEVLVLFSGGVSPPSFCMRCSGHYSQIWR